MSNWESRRDFDSDKRLAKEEAFTDMLEALSLVADYLMGDEDIPDHVADAINNAIKKARGQS
jgi:hypothetical protein